MSRLHCKLPASRALIGPGSAGLMLCAAMALQACGSAPPPRLMSLPLPVQYGAVAAPASTAPRALAIRRVHVPDYLQTDKVLYRASPTELREWPDVAWANDIEPGITDHLAMRLRTALPGWVVCERGCPAGPDVESLHVEIAPLDYVRSEHTLQAQARWQLLQPYAAPPGTGATTAVAPPGPTPSNGTRAYRLQVAPDTPEGHMAAIGTLLDMIAKDIAASLAPR